MADDLFRRRRDNEGDYAPLTRSCEDSEDELDLPRIRSRNSSRCICVRSPKARLFTVALVLLALVLIIIIMAAAGKWRSPHGQLVPDAETSLIVQAGCFEVKGKRSEGVFVFKGIPYAEPPIGPLRWKPPVPIREGSLKCNISPYNATRFGAKCYQRGLLNTSKYEGSEDCLFLNVWTPSLDPKANLPVMVWIHGGSLIQLDGATPTYSPNEQVTKDTNIVFVSMNYRLNAFGFMALDVLSKDSETNTSGNYGFRDQILSLRWVQRNIVNFGGNPNLVTLFGQSSGGTSIHALLASPGAKGLFHRAWLSSPSAVFNASLAEASKINLGFLNNTGCANITCLRSLTPQKILDSVPWDVFPYWNMTDLFDLPTKEHFDGPLAIVDGSVVPSIPKTTWEGKGPGVDVPVMIGSTAQEVDLMPSMVDVKNWNSSQYEDYVSKKLKTFGGNISQIALNLYPFENGSNAEYLVTSMASDVRANCPLDTLAEAIKNSSNFSVYRYVVTARPSKEVHGYLSIPFAPAFSFHTIDIFAFFGTLGEYIKPLSKSDVEFQETFRTQMLSFVLTGKVNSTEWTEFPSSVAIIDANLTITKRYHEDECRFWDGYFSYAWIN